MTQQHNITVLPELESTLFPQRPEERAELEADILAEGVRDPLVVWPREDEGDLVLVDGQNRYAIACEHDLPFDVLEKDFDSVEDVIEWIIHNQLGRRNLTDEQRAVAIGYLYEHRKPARGKPPKQQRKPEKFSDLGNDDNSEEESSEQTDKSPEPVTAQLLGEVAGVTEKTVRNAAKFARAYEQFKQINPEAAAKVVSGEIKDALTRLPTMTEQAMEKAAERV